jgi:hypothetical protein
MRTEFNYRDSSGNIKEGYMDLNDYRLAAEHNMKASALVNARHSDADRNFGSAFEQGMRYLGIFPKGDPAYGVQKTTIKQILDGTCMQMASGFQLAGGMIVSPKAPVGGSTPATRLFFPEIVLNFIEEELRADYGLEESAWNRMFAMNTSIQSEVWTQPLIKTTAPGEQDMRPIAQNTLPTNMVSITASQYSQALGAISIGLQISEQAQRDATVDLVGIIVREQAMGQRMRHLWRDLGRVVTGNPDASDNALAQQGPLTPVVFKDTFDPTAPEGSITHAGYIKMLWDPSRIYNWNMMIGPLESYLAIERRLGRPLMIDANTSGVNVGDAGTYGIDPGNPQLINFGTSRPSYLIVPDGVVPANTLVMFDSRYALARVTNVSANYSAVEQQVLQRASFFRFDLSEFVYRFREEALQWIDFGPQDSDSA